MQAQITDNSQGELFRSRLSNQIEMEHELVKISDLIEWEELEGEYRKIYKDSKKGGQPAKPIRLMIGLVVLQNMYKLSDEGVVMQWRENVYWQYLCGYDYLQWGEVIDPSSLTRFRKRLGKEGMEKLLAITVSVAIKSGLIKERDCKKVTVDTTVMAKNIEYPTDFKLMEKARKKLVSTAEKAGIVLRQNYNLVSKKLLRQIGGYLHAKQIKRAKRVMKKFKTVVGRLLRDCKRKIDDTPKLKVQFDNIVKQTEHLLARKKKDRNKLYSLHEPDVVCISKGKAHQRYEFGSKVSLSITHKGAGIVTGCEALSGAPYDGHTLKKALDLSEQITGVKVKRAFVDKGYKGHGIEDTEVFISGQRKNITPSIKKQLKRRQAIEPHIGHMKQSCKLGLSRLRGAIGDQVNALLSASAYNLRLILNHLRFILSFFQNLKFFEIFISKLFRKFFNRYSLEI
jgi:transposase, IS5 family